MNRQNSGASVARIAAFMILCAVLLAAVSPFARKSAVPVQLVTVGGATAIGTYLLTLLFTRWEHIRLRDIGAAVRSGSALRLAIGFVIGLGIVTVHAVILLLAGHVRYATAARVNWRTVPLFLLGYLALACREELAFHGYPLRRMNSLYGLYVAQITIAMVFAAEHMLGGYSLENAVLGAAAGSLLFGMASIATRGLAVPIGLHVAWNFGQWVLGGKEVPGVYVPVVTEGYRGSVERTGMIAYVAVMAATTALFWVWNRRSVQAAKTRLVQ